MNTEANNRPEAKDQLRPQHWKWAAAASMADYIDAGSTVSIGVTLAIWAAYFHVGAGPVGIIGALGAGGISTGIGAILGGRLGDVLGRKRIYQYDLLVYALGALLIVFSFSFWQFILGIMLIGLAFGADVPTSWSLIAEFSPKGSRGKLMGLTYVFWSLGPVVTSLLSLAFTPLGVLGARLIFVHLFIAAMVTWFLRRGLKESVRWKESRDRTGTPALMSREQIRAIFSRRNVKGIVFLIAVYLTFNLVSGTIGSVFQPYILKTVGATTQFTSVAISLLGGVIGILSTSFIYMRFADRVSSRLLFGIAAALMVLAYVPMLVFGLTITTALIDVVLFGMGSGFGIEAFFRTWSGELFPTAVRNTAQGLCWGTVKIATGGFRFVVPLLAVSGFNTLIVIVVSLLAASGIIGILFAPRTRGRSLDEIDLLDDALIAPEFG